MIAMHRRLPAWVLAALLGAAPALLAPPAWAAGKGEGADKGQKHERKAKRAVDDGRVNAHVRSEVGKGTRMARKPLQPGAYFNDRSREAVARYYSAGPGGKDCPPGLAKKNNGCLPPGQARKAWQIGEPLPSTVVYEVVPRRLVAQLPPVPPGHRYVQVAGDILLIAVGSKMVVDGINGLMR